MISYNETKKFYETTPAWDDDIYGQFTPRYFSFFIKNELEPLIVSDSMKVLNAGSGGIEYCSKGIQFHVDLAETKLKGKKNAVVGNVINLPYEDNSFDIVLSLNGFHAFPDKEAAYAETFRVLKKGGTFCGCFYIRGACRRTDWFIRNLYVPRGYFTPPFETMESLRSRLSGLYEKADADRVEGIACFRCVK